MKVLFIVYDNASHIHWFPLGVAYLAAACEADGHDIHIVNMDMNHMSDADLARELCSHEPEIVACGAIGGYWQYKQLVEISRVVNESPRRSDFLYVLGGHGPSPEPEFFTERMKCDAICIGEADRTFPELLKAREEKRDLLSVPGIYCNGKFSPSRKPIEIIDFLPHPLWSKFPVEYYRLLRLPNCKPTDFTMPVLTGRGCPFNCTFCYRMDPGYRPRRPQLIREEIETLKGLYGITYIAFADELLMSSLGRTRDICEAIEDLQISWSCNGRLNYADPQTLKAMKRAGCVFINYGIEAMDNEVLENIKKQLTTGQADLGVQNTIQAGISPGLNIIWGNIGDSPRTLARAVDFLCRNADLSQIRTIRPVTPYPGSELYHYAIDHGLLKGPEDFYESKHTNSDLFSVQFTGMSNDDAHACLSMANEILLQDHYHKQIAKTIDTARKFYATYNPAFRGFRQT